MKLIFDFRCANEHTHESWVESSVHTDQCPECELTATRIISGTSFKLEGVSGDFPTAADKWTKLHERAGTKPYNP
jgi:hypothetical protein